MREISPTDLKSELDTGATPVLLDVREPWEVGRACLPNTQLIPMRELPNRLRELDPTREIVVLCHHGIRSRAVCRFLEEARFPHVSNLTGGIDAWARQVDPSVPVY